MSTGDSILWAFKNDGYRLGDLQVLLYDRTRVDVFGEGYLTKLYHLCKSSSRRSPTGILGQLFCGMTDLSHDALTSYLANLPVLVLVVWRSPNTFTEAGIAFPVLFQGKPPERMAFAGYCLAGDTPVHTDSGVQLISVCCPGAYVRDSTDMSRIIGSKLVGYDRLLTLTTKSGRKLRCTANHRIRVLDTNGNWSWKEAGSFRVGDPLYIARGTRGLFGDLCNISPEMAELIGWIVGDGSISTQFFTYRGVRKENKSSRFISIACGPHLADVDRVCELVERVYGFRPHVSKHRKANCHYVKFSLKLAEAAKLGILGKGADKQPPAFLTASSREVIIGFLRGLFDADGHLAVNTGRNKRGIAFVYMTISQKIKYVVDQCLLLIGVVPVWRFRAKTASRGDYPNSRPFWLLQLGRLDTLRLCVALRWSFDSPPMEVLYGGRHDGVPVWGLWRDLRCGDDPRPWRRLSTRNQSRIISFTRLKKAAEETKNVDARRRVGYLLRQLPFTDRLAHVEEGEVLEPVYDIEVSGSTHEFLANGIPVHNCYFRAFWGTAEAEILGMLGLAYLFLEFGLRAIHGIRYEGNELTARFTSRFGFRETGRVPRYMLKDGMLVTGVVSSLLIEDFERYVARRIVELYAPDALNPS